MSSLLVNTPPGSRSNDASFYSLPASPEETRVEQLVSVSFLRHLKTAAFFISIIQGVLHILPYLEAGGGMCEGHRR